MIAGSATTVASNPFWVIQTTQTTALRKAKAPAPATTGSGSTAGPASVPHDVTTSHHTEHLSFLQTIRAILKAGGLKAFWRGLGPAMVLVINPVLQYTIFEQLKNILIRRRTAILRAASKKSKVVAVLSDVDYFFLGALAKLGVYRFSYDSILLHMNVLLKIGVGCLW